MANYKTKHPLDKEVISAIETFSSAKTNLPININSILVNMIKDKKSEKKFILDKITLQSAKRNVIAFQKNLSSLTTIAASQSVLIKSHQELQGGALSHQDDKLVIKYMIRWLQALDKYSELQFNELKMRYLPDKNLEQERSQIASLRQVIQTILREMGEKIMPNIVHQKQSSEVVQEIAKACSVISRIAPQAMVKEQAAALSEKCHKEIFSSFEVQRHLAF